MGQKHCDIGMLLVILLIHGNVHGFQKLWETPPATQVNEDDVLYFPSLRELAHVTPDWDHKKAKNADLVPNEKKSEEITASTGTRKRFRQRRQAARDSNWDDRTMTYSIDYAKFSKQKSPFDKNSLEIIANAMKYISARTCINFHENSTAEDRAHFTTGACYSLYGQYTGVQEILLDGSCGVGVSEALHEIFHALGLYHTHSRNDRDKHVVVNNSARHDYTEKIEANQIINHVPYDYGSIMHYPASEDFGQSYSMTPLDKRYLRTIGSRLPSFYDLMVINTQYNCNELCQNSSTAVCANGGTPNPRKCDECLCPYGYGGRLCDKRPEGCGDELKASSSWEIKTIRIDDSTTETDRNQDYKMCNYWITAPPGKTIQVRVTELTMKNCDYGCRVNGIEPKILKEKRKTSPRICCKEQLNEILTSELNPTPIFVYSMVSSKRPFWNYYRADHSEFTFQFRYI